MTKSFDVAVVGAGPGGLMAARTAARQGLSVALLERNDAIAPVKRGCAMVLLTLNEPYFGEEKIYLDREKGELTFRSYGFSVPYTGPSRDMFSWHILSPGGSRVQFGSTPDGISAGEDARTSSVHDKGLLLSGLLKECRQLGVTIITGVNVTGTEKCGEKVRVLSDRDPVEAPFVIAADGANSRLAQTTRANRDRLYYGLMKIQGAKITGVNGFDANTFYSFVAGSENPSYSVLVPMAVQEEGSFQAFSVDFDPAGDVAGKLDFLLSGSHFADSFKNASIVERTSAIENIFSPMQTPYHDQVVFVGDAAWCQEMEITPAMMCGWQAANSVASALNNNCISGDGIAGYLDWWDKTCLATHDYRDYLRNYAMCFLLSNDELDFLLSRVNTVLPAIFNPYRAFSLLGPALAESMDTIARERPGLAAKMQTFATASLETLMEKPIRDAQGM